MLAGMTRAATYLRISRDLTGEGLGVERQREAAEQYARASGYEISDVFTDNDISAAGGKRRPGFEALLEALDDGRFSVIIAWNWDRLTRNRADTVRLIETCQRAKAKVALVRGSDLDMSTPSGRMTAGILAEVAQNEIETKGERQSLAQRQRAMMGRAPKGTRPLGYAIDGRVIDDEAVAVRRLYEAFGAGASLRALAAALSGTSGDDLPDVPTMQKHTRTLAMERNARRATEGQERRPVPEDGPWSSSTVLGILRNPRYAGYSTYTPKETLTNGDRRRSWRAQILRNDDGEPVLGRWEPIVRPELWEAVQDRLDDPARITNRAGTDRKHLGSGLYRCGICDKPVRGHGQSYRCAGHTMRSRTLVDEFVLQIVRRRLALSDLQDLLPTADEPRRQEIKTKIAEHRARIRRAQKDYDAELIEGFDLKRIRGRENAAIDSLEVERRRLSTGASANGVVDAQDPVAAFEAGDLGIRRSTIDTLCEVRLYPHPRGVRTFNPDSVGISWR